MQRTRIERPKVRSGRRCELLSLDPLDPDILRAKHLKCVRRCATRAPTVWRFGSVR